MKRLTCMLLILILLLGSFSPTIVYAIGEGNVDGGGGGIGEGTSSNKWNPGDEGVRVTVIRASDHATVTTPIDFTNKSPSDIRLHFGEVSKIAYSNGQGLSESKTRYTYTNPAQALPKIILTKTGNNIAAIKAYFTDEQVIRSIAQMTGMDFNVLVGGDYKLLLEPVAYLTFQDVKIAVTATEAALYDEEVGGLLRKKMGALSHKNLPLSLFLEIPDLGYPAWSGLTNKAASNADIKSSLGLGVVRFKNKPTEPPVVSTYDYEYRVNTQVITAITISGGQSDPDNPVSATFYVNGRSYQVDHIYYPEGDSQLAWIRWTTPSTPQELTIQVAVSGGSTSQGTIKVKVVDLDQNPPPNPVADDRNDSYTKPSRPNKPQKIQGDWTIWRPWWQVYWVWHSNGDDGGYWCDHGWWAFDLDRYQASLTATMAIKPDDKNPTARGRTMKSGYGINQLVTTSVSTNQSMAVTGAQNAVTYFPEFQYQGFWRLLEPMGNGYSQSFQFKKNHYSTYNRPTHFTPIWMPDGSYTPYTWVLDSWTPAGMLSLNLTDSVQVQGNLWADWHIAPQNPSDNHR